MAKIFACRKCGSVDLFIKDNGAQCGLYCKDCGAWQKWLGKDERRIVELQLSEQSKPKQTNFDRITESPVELAKFLQGVWNGVVKFDMFYCDECGNCLEDGGCKENSDEADCIVRWLNQPAQEVTNNA